MPELSPTALALIVQSVLVVVFIIRLEGKVKANEKDLQRLEAANERCWNRVEATDLTVAEHNIAIKQFSQVFNPDKSREFWSERGAAAERLANMRTDIDHLREQVASIETTYIKHLQNAINHALSGHGNGCS